jgi:ribosomal protein L18
MAKRTTHRSSAGKKLYAVRNADGSFRDIQQYEIAHRADLAAKSKAEKASDKKSKKKGKKKAAKKTGKKTGKKAGKKASKKG